MEGIVIDTNVFVAARFNPRSASARILTGIREGRFRLMWNEPTRRETEMILRRIPRLNWEKVADLFQPEGKFTESVDPDAFALISDPDDRKFAALSAAARAPLVTVTCWRNQGRWGLRPLRRVAFSNERAHAAN